MQLRSATEIQVLRFEAFDEATDLDESMGRTVVQLAVLVAIQLTRSSSLRPEAIASKLLTRASCSRRGPQVVVARAGDESGEGYPPDEELKASMNNRSNEASALYAALRARQRQVDKEGAEVTVRWRRARCTSRVVAALGDDWVRRCALDFPLCAFGTASGAVHVVDVSKSTEMLERGESTHARYTEADTSALHGEFDGGGVTAIALRAATLATGGRNGDIAVWRMEGATDRALEAKLECGEHAIVSDLAISNANGAIFASSLDGTVRRFDVDKERHWTETWSQRLASPVLCLALNHDDDDETGFVACGCSEGTISVLDTGAGERLMDDWRPFVEPQAGARSVAFAQHDYIYTGSFDGRVKRRRLDKLARSYRDQEESLLPSHNGPVVSLAHRPGILATAAQDSTIRIWDLRPRSDKQPPKCLFGFGGFKVWIGSVDCDERRLISDGSDNTIIMHDFGASATES